MVLSNIQQAAEAVQAGLLVVYPTDTLYALGAQIFDVEAVRKVFFIKHRPFSIPLPVAVADIDALHEVALINQDANKIARRFLPGKLTMILSKKDVVPSIISAHKPSIAVRIPADETALRLLSLTGPLTVTSANIHNQKTPATVEEIKDNLDADDISIYIDMGVRMQSPSTIVDLTQSPPQIIRKGAITEDEIIEVVSS
ncbi:MAG: L-threonylcarbamoyladenylate synthase [Thermoplasmatota archaeon]